MQLTFSELFDCFMGLATSWWPARAVVEKALGEEARKAVHPSGKVAALAGYAPWQSHLSDLEKEGFGGLKDGDILYMLFPDSTKGYRIQAVPKEGAGFQNRKSLPEAWRGVRDEKCSEVTGVPACTSLYWRAVALGQDLRALLYRLSLFSLLLEGL